MVGPGASVPSSSCPPLPIRRWVPISGVSVRPLSPCGLRIPGYGLLVNTVFSLGGTSGPSGTRYTVTTINPFINYNFVEGWFVGMSNVTTANWDAGGEKWTLPAGGQFGRLIKIADKLSVNMLVGAYYNALRPAGAGTWELRTQVTAIF
jgi:hypothetical protein